MPVKSDYPLPSFHFQVEWGGARLGFTEVTGLDMQTEVIEYREGNEKSYTKSKMPGLRKFSNIVLKRGYFLGDTDFYKWARSTSFFNSGQKFRRTVTIKLLDDEHKPVMTWRLLNAWPTKLQAGDLKAQANEVLIETLELVHEGLEIVE
jgi:phage tail-like protein